MGFDAYWRKSEEGDQNNPKAAFEFSDGTIVQQDQQSFFTRPDSGFYQQISYTKSELEWDLVNLDEESATNRSINNIEERNSFIIHEAIEEKLKTLEKLGEQRQ